MHLGSQGGGPLSWQLPGPIRDLFAGAVETDRRVNLVIDINSDFNYDPNQIPSFDLDILHSAAAL